MICNKIIEAASINPVSEQMKSKDYQAIPYSINRRMISATAAQAREQNNIQAISEVDISEPRRLIREQLYQTLTFDHDIVDGAPAARFVKRFSELLKSGELLRAEIETIKGQKYSQPGGRDEI